MTLRSGGAAEALRRDASFVPALKELAAAATAKGRLDEAARALTKGRGACGRRTRGVRRSRQHRICGRAGRTTRRSALQRALALDPDAAACANNTMGLTALNAGDSATARSGIFARRSASSPTWRRRRTTWATCWLAARPTRKRASTSKRPSRSNPAVRRGAPQLRSGAGADRLVCQQPSPSCRRRSKLAPRSGARRISTWPTCWRPMGRRSDAEREYAIGCPKQSQFGDPEDRRGGAPLASRTRALGLDFR